MKEFKFRQEDTVLLIKQNNKYYGLDYKCGDCGICLKEGVLESGKIRCALYGTAYNFKGEIEQFPGLNPILSYDVKAQKGIIKLKIKKALLETSQVQRSMTARDMKNEKTFVLIGCGHMTATCIEYLRQYFSGRIIVISRETHIPYSNQKIYSNPELTVQELLLRPFEFYDNNSIEMILNKKIKKIDTKLKQIILSETEKIYYNKLLIEPEWNTSKIEEYDYRNVLKLDTHDDLIEFKLQLEKVKNVIILGSDYRALEVACYCSRMDKRVTILEKDSLILNGIFGYDTSTRILEYLEEHKIEVILETKIKGQNGNTENLLESIELEDGRIINVELILMFTEPLQNTDLFKDNGIIHNESSNTTNQLLQTNFSDIYTTDFKERIGHSGIFQQLGKMAALIMLGKKADSRAIPHYWFQLFDKQFTFVGDLKFDSLCMDGNLKGMAFDVFYFDENENLTGILSCKPNNLAVQYSQFLIEEKKLKRNELEEKLGKPED